MVLETTLSTIIVVPRIPTRKYLNKHDSVMTLTLNDYQDIQLTQV